MIKKIFNFQFSIFNSERGFTVLESIVAIMVLSLSISGAFSAVQQSLSQAIIAKDEIKAFYLAQEAIEIIRNKRDGNQLAKIFGSGSWLDGITSVCPFSTAVIKNTCRVDANPIPPTITYCGSSWGSCPYLRQNQSTFLYNYTSGNTTNFKREIQLESINANEISVTVRVSWTKGIISREFKVKTHLFNWI